LGKYNEIMERIYVTPKMRQRVVEGVIKSSAKEAKKNKIINFPKIYKYATIAACVAALLVGALVYRNVVTNNYEPSDEQMDVAQQGIIEYSSAAELSDAIGFDVQDISNVPFEVTNVVYSDFFGDIAEIDYYGENDEQLTFRKSIGTDDNSGDYTEYDIIKEIETCGYAITLKGSDEGCSLVIWTDGEYSYSISSTIAYSEDIWVTIISEVCNN